MSNLCPHCQYENREMARFCAECGAEFAIEPQTAAPDQLAAVFAGAAEDLGPGTLVAGRDYVLDGAADSTAAPESAIDADATAPERVEGAAEDCQPSQGVFLLVGQRSDVGDMRRGQANEDSLFVLTAAAASSSLPGPTLGLYLVADGMGGHMDGEIASRTACEVIASDLLTALNLPTLGGYTPDTVLELIDGALHNANHQIYAAAAADGSNMGTTAVLALVIDDQAYFANAGDSRAYLWRAGELNQITEDHSHVYTLVKNGLIDEDAIYTHPRRNEIFRSLGAAPVVDVECFQAALVPGDLLLLCSDGLWEMLRREGITDVLELNLGDPQVICDELVRRANLAGGDDNITVVAVRVVAQQIA